MQIAREQQSRRLKTSAKHANNLLMIPAPEGRSPKKTSIGVPEIAVTLGCASGDRSASSHTTHANEEDRKKLLTLQKKIRRQLLWTRRSMAWELALTAVALVAVFYASPQWAFLAWAGLELGLFFHGLATCRASRRALYFLQMDLARGVVRESIGRVRSFRLFWRVVRDNTTGAEYVIVVPLIRPSSIAAGTEVVYRAAIQSRVAISLYERTL